MLEKYIIMISLYTICEYGRHLKVTQYDIGP